MRTTGEKLWTPNPERIARANITAFTGWLARRSGQAFPDYHAMWRWSVEQPEEFWQAIWDYFGITSSTQPEGVLESTRMPGARWFPGARVNFTRYLISRGAADAPVIFHRSEIRQGGVVSWNELRDSVFALARELRALGVSPGDRVVGYLPAGPEAAISLLAVTLIGAVWSCCSPDFGSRSVLDRFKQIEPRVLITVDGYRYAGKDFDRRREVRDMVEALPSLERVITVPYLFASEESAFPRSASWQETLERGRALAGDPTEDVPFDHPLWVVYTSGTTGLPKPIVHGHGGMLLELLKLNTLHLDLRPTSRVFFFTTTGWIMFPVLLSTLLTGCSIVFYDGSPAHPDLGTLWRLCDELEVTHFGTSPSFVNVMRQNRFEPRAHGDFKALECVLCTGSPLTPESFTWIYDHVKRDLWVTSVSGGTDIVTALVGGVPTLPVYNGEIQVRCLGMPVKSFDADGKPVIGQEGELVLTAPIPTMPLYFWNDPGNRRYLESYFEVFPGIWRHGDLLTITERGTCIISGRADATLNRHGVRIGTGEIYRTLETFEKVRDSLVVNLELSGGRFFMPLFVVLKDGAVLDEALRARICRRLREDHSPRHVPDAIYQVPDIPYTLTGKKMEVPVKKILMGGNPERVANRDATANPAALDHFVRFAQQQTDYSL